MGSLSSHSVFGCMASQEGMLQPGQGLEHAVHWVVWVYDAGWRLMIRTGKVFGETRMMCFTFKEKWTLRARAHSNVKHQALRACRLCGDGGASR